MSTQEYMDGAFLSRACLKRAIDSMFAPNPWYYKLRREVRKRVAIDYRKEWKKLSDKCGAFGVNIPHEAVSVSLRSLMENQVKQTIDEREKLMETYLKETMTTDICKAKDKNFDIRIFLYGVCTGTVLVSRTNFERWLEKRKEEK